MAYPTMRLNRLFGDFSGAFTDLGTFLPLVVGVLALRSFDPSGVLVGFGLFALVVVAVVYRRPMPVQSMKAVATLVIATGITPAAVATSGLIMGAVLTVLAVSGIVGRLARLIPQSVLLGIQLGVGVHLAPIWRSIDACSTRGSIACRRLPRRRWPPSPSTSPLALSRA